MNRKKFITSLSITSAGAAFLNPQTFSKSFLKDEPPIIKPPRLKNGDKLAIIAPGSYISEEELQDSIKNLSGLGFETTYSKKVLLQNGYFAGTDKERADDLMEKFSKFTFLCTIYIRVFSFISNKILNKLIKRI